MPGANANWRNTATGTLTNFDGSANFFGSGNVPGRAPVLEPFMSLGCGTTTTWELAESIGKSFFRTSSVVTNQRYNARQGNFVIDNPGPIDIVVTAVGFTPFVTLARSADNIIKATDGSGVIVYTVPANQTGPFTVEVTSVEPYATGEFTIHISCVAPLDMPLTHAVLAPQYSDAVGVHPSMIYGARGGYLFEFDLSGVYTGRNLPFANPFLGESYLAWDSASNKLWASMWADFAGSEKPTSKGFYQIDVGTMQTQRFLAFVPPTTAGNTTYSLAGLGNFLSSNPGPWPPTSGQNEQADFYTVWNVGAAIGDAFFYCTGPPGAWLGTFSPAPVAYDFYLQNVVSGDHTIYYALDRQATPSDPSFTLSTQPTGRANVIIHVPAGSRLSLNIPVAPAFACNFGCTGTMTTTDIVSYLNNILALGPRRIGFGTNGHLYFTMEESTVSSGFGSASFYSGTPGSSMYEANISGQIIAVVNTVGSGNDVNGYPGVNCFWLDPATNDLWMGNDMGLSRCQGGAVTAFLEVPAFIAANPPWFSGAVYGVDYVPSTGNFYMVTDSPVVAVVPKANPDNAHVTTFVLPRSSVRPRNIRYAAFKNRLYIPAMVDNVVLEVDPVTHNVTNTFTGFDCPWDILVTTDTVFAIQLGKTGLAVVTQ